MVDWAHLIPTIIGSGLVIFVLQFAVNQQVLIPNIDFRTNDTGKLFEIGNVGLSTATDVIITVHGNNLTKPIFLSTDLVLNDNVVFTPSVPKTVWQIQIPRLSSGNASHYFMLFETKPNAIYVTYKQGSEQWPKPGFWDNPLYIVITTIAAIGVGLILFSYLHRRYKRQFYRLKFTAKVTHDMYQVFKELHNWPYFTDKYWDKLYSTQKWDTKNKMVGSILEEKDAALFNEFYSKIVSRDITIKNIIEGIWTPLKEKLEAEYAKDKEEITRLPVTKQGKMLARRFKKYTDDLDSLNDSKEADIEIIMANTKSLKKDKTFDKTLVKLSPNTRIDNSNVNDVLPAIFEINYVLWITARKCYRNFNWSLYSVEPKDVTESDSKSHWYTTGIILKIVGLCSAVAVAFVLLAYYLFTR
jgi:hypothetical protein